MLRLCRRMAELFRNHPILLLPYLAADLLAICLWRLRGLAEKGIFRWFTTGHSHSVLGGDIAFPSYDQAALTKASIAYAPIGFATIIAVVCLFVAALVATADIVNSIEQKQRPDAREILVSLAAYWRKVILFALRFLIIFGVFAAGTTGLSIYILSLTHRQDLLTSFWLLAGLMLVVMGCTAWLVMPAAMRMLRGEATVLVSTQTRNRGTILAILAAEAGVAIGFLIQKLEASIMYDSQWEVTAVSVFNSIVANAPYALLFVVLALLATEFSKESENKNVVKFRELLPLLMPLHFGKREEPPQVEE